MGRVLVRFYSEGWLLDEVRRGDERLYVMGSTIGES